MAAPPVGGPAAASRSSTSRRSMRSPPGCRASSRMRAATIVPTWHTVGNWPPPAPERRRLEPPRVRCPGAPRCRYGHGQACRRHRRRVMVFDSDFAFDHRFFLERQRQLRGTPGRRDAAAGRRPGPTEDTARQWRRSSWQSRRAPMSSAVRLRNGVLPEGLDAALDGASPLPHIVLHQPELTGHVRPEDESLLDSVCRADLEHIADEIRHVPCAQGITVVTGTGNGDYGFPAAMKQVIARRRRPRRSRRHDEPVRLDGGSAFAARSLLAIARTASFPTCAVSAGKRPGGAYIVAAGAAEFGLRAATFPVAPGAPPASGWALFSGTSAATAEVAGVCASSRRSSPGLAPRRSEERPVNTAGT